jgi:hypothetical protein
MLIWFDTIGAGAVLLSPDLVVDFRSHFGIYIISSFISLSAITAEQNTQGSRILPHNKIDHATLFTSSVTRIIADYISKKKRIIAE